jgi:hypothetical protein
MQQLKNGNYFIPYILIISVLKSELQQRHNVRWRPRFFKKSEHNVQELLKIKESNKIRIANKIEVLKNELLEWDENGQDEMNWN